MTNIDKIVKVIGILTDTQKATLVEAAKELNSYDEKKPEWVYWYAVKIGMEKNTAVEGWYIDEDRVINERLYTALGDVNQIIQSIV